MPCVYKVIWDLGSWPKFTLYIWGYAIIPNDFGFGQHAYCRSQVIQENFSQLIWCISPILIKKCRSVRIFECIS
jgi:hypothetical protein